MPLEFRDREGRPLTTDEWARLKEDEAYCQIESTNVAGGWVSTAWIGVVRPKDPGQGIFETLVREPGGAQREYRQQYATEAEARAGHVGILAALLEVTAERAVPRGPELTPFGVPCPEGEHTSALDLVRGCFHLSHAELPEGGYLDMQLVVAKSDYAGVQRVRLCLLCCGALLGMLHELERYGFSRPDRWEGKR